MPYTLLRLATKVTGTDLKDFNSTDIKHLQDTAIYAAKPGRIKLEN
jgi:hypothetical protein